MKKIGIFIILGIYCLLIGWGTYNWLYGEKGYFSRLQKEAILSKLDTQMDHLKVELEETNKEAYLYESNEAFKLEKEARGLGLKKSHDVILKVNPDGTKVPLVFNDPSAEADTIETSLKDSSRNSGYYLGIIFGGIGLFLVFMMIVRLLSHRTLPTSDENTIS